MAASVPHRGPLSVGDQRVLFFFQLACRPVGRRLVPLSPPWLAVVWAVTSAATGPVGRAAAPAEKGGGTALLALRLPTMQAIAQDSYGVIDGWHPGYLRRGGSPWPYGSCLHG